MCNGNRFFNAIKEYNSTEEILQAVKEWIIETFGERDYGNEIVAHYDNIEDLLFDFEAEMAIKLDVP